MLKVSDVREGDLLVSSDNEEYEIVNKVIWHIVKDDLRIIVNTTTVNEKLVPIPTYHGLDDLFVESPHDDVIDGWYIARRNLIIDFDLGI
jgi:hypothetical protein